MTHSRVLTTVSALLRPQANINQVSALVDTWYRIQASGQQAAEIQIYDAIGGYGLSAKSFATELKALGKLKNITVRIHSGGGDVFDGMAIYNLLKQHPAKITVYIDGLAASMASVIAMAGDQVIMPANAMMMVHKPWGIQGGNSDDLRRYAELLDKVEAAFLAAYRDKTGLDDQQLQALLTEETWLTGAEAIAQGFADQLAEPLQAVATLTSNKLKEFENMPRNALDLLKPQANLTAPAAGGAQTTPPLETTLPELETVRAQVLAEEQQRRDQIQALFAHFGGNRGAALAGLQTECLVDLKCSVTQAKDRLLAKLAADTTPSQGNVHIHAGNGNLVGDSVRASLSARLGQAEQQSDNSYNHMSLRELARASLADRGIGVAAVNPMQMVGMAFTHSSSDFGNILLDVAHKSLLSGWEESEETFERWTRKGQLSDFKTAHRVGIDAFPTLRQVRPGAEYKFVTANDRGESIALATYGELFSITRQAIINDDLSVLSGIPMSMGRAAKATIGDLVYAVLISNQKMADGKALFHNDHANLLTGAPTVEHLDKARQLMRTQKSGDRHLNIRPAYVLVPTALEAATAQTIKSVSVKGADVNAGVANPIQNFAEVIAEPRLDDASATAWYLAAAQGRDTIEVAYLNGIESPFIDQMEGFNTDGITSKVRIDAGVAALDHRGLVKSTG